MLQGTAFVIRGTLRTRVFKALQLEKNPMFLAKVFNRDSSTISGVLVHLQEATLVKHITEKNKRSTFYKHTQNGKMVFKEMQKLKLFDYLLIEKGDK